MEIRYIENPLRILYRRDAYRWHKIYFFEIGPKSLHTLVEVDKAKAWSFSNTEDVSKVLRSYRYQQLDGYQFDEFRDSILHITYIDSGRD